MEGETPRPPAAASKALNDDDLLAEILLRVGLPTTLVRAAAVCRRWLHHASDRKFLRRFREHHPPRLLGIHVIEQDWFSTPTASRFLPVLPQPPELAAVARRVSSSMGGYGSDDYNTWTRILGCRNGSLLIEEHEDGRGSTLGVHSLLCPEKAMTFLPPRPYSRLRIHNFIYSEILINEGECGLSYLYLLVPDIRDRKPEVQVYMLRDGVWCMHHNLTMDDQVVYKPDVEPLLVDDSVIYISVARSGIIVLDLTSSSLSKIQLPQGVDGGGIGEGRTRLACAADAAGVYLVHVKELQLRVWLHKGDDWLLVDSICLQEMLAGLSMLGCDASLRIKCVGDNAEFVFLKMGRCALQLDVRCRTLRKVYEVTKEGRFLGDI